MELTINYYQITKEKKKIISAKIKFDRFITPLTNITESLTYNYTLIINVNPLTQSQLTVAFAFDWPVYMILYLIVGFIFLLEALVIFFYHYTFTR